MSRKIISLDASLVVFFSIHFAVRFYCTKMFKSHRNKEFSSDENTTKVSVRSRCQCCNLTLVLQRQTVLFLLSQPVEKVDSFLLQVLQFPLHPKPLKAIRSELTRLTFFHRSYAHLTHDNAQLFLASYPVTHQNRCDAIFCIWC